MSRLLPLNDDCLWTLCRYLTYNEMVNLAESCAQLGEFMFENILPKYARKLFVYGQLVFVDRVRYDLESFRRTIKPIQTHLTQLHLNSKFLINAPKEAFVQTILDNCPRLVSLRLFGMNFNKKKRSLPLNGSRCAHLKELCLTMCEFVDGRWLIKFIGQLSGLETLMLHDCYSDSWYDENDDAQNDSITPMLTCSPLRKLSVRSRSQKCSRLLLNTAMHQRTTLRELYLDVCWGNENSRLYATIVEGMPQLEALWVRPLSVIGHQSLSATLAKAYRLRKIILYKAGDASTTTNWMRQLAAGPNRVEHLVLLRTPIEEAVCTNVGSFGAQVRVLELRQPDVMVTTPAASENLLKTMIGRFSGLRTLLLLECADMEVVLLSAIRTCVQLRRVVIRGSMLENTLPKIVEGLRSAAVASAKRCRLVVEHELDEWSCPQALSRRDRDILQANSDILTVVRKMSTVLQLITYTRCNDDLPVDEYMLEMKNSSYHYDENDSSSSIYHSD